MFVLRTVLIYYIASIVACFFMFVVMSLVEGAGSFPDVKVDSPLDLLIILTFATPIAALRMMSTTVFLALPLIIVSWRKPAANYGAHAITGAVILLVSMLLILPLFSGGPWPATPKWYEVGISITAGALGGLVYCWLNRFGTKR